MLKSPNFTLGQISLLNSVINFQNVLYQKHLQKFRIPKEIFKDLASQCIAIQ